MGDQARRAPGLRPGHSRLHHGQLRHDGMGVAAGPERHVEGGLHRRVRVDFPAHLHRRAADQGARLRLCDARERLPARCVVPARLCRRLAGVAPKVHSWHGQHERLPSHSRTAAAARAQARALPSSPVKHPFCSAFCWINCLSIFKAGKLDKNFFFNLLPSCAVPSTISPIFASPAP